MDTTTVAVGVAFLVALALYLMRRKSRRWREQREVDETDVPYGPSPLTLEEAPEEVGAH